MQRVGFIILLLLALGLGAWVYFYEIQGEEGRQQAADAEKQLFTLKTEQVTHVELENSHGKFLFEKVSPLPSSTTAGAAASTPTPTPATADAAAPMKNSLVPTSVWKLTQPAEVPADARSVEDALYALTALRYTKVVQEKATDLTPFGLATPLVKFTFQTPEGSQTLLVGDEAPFGAGRYIATASASKSADGTKVYVSSYPLTDRLDKDLLGWRDRRILTFTIADVKRLQVIPPEGPGLDLSRDGDHWVSAHDAGFSLDSAAVDALLYDLQGMQTQTFTGQTDVTLFGLNAPILKVRVEVGDSRTEHSVLLGPGYGEDKKIPVIKAEGDEIRLLDSGIIGKLNKTPIDLRDTRVLSIKRFNLEQLTASLENQTLTARRANEAWTMEGSLKDKVKPADVDVILDDLVALRGESFVDGVTPASLATYGMDKPAITLTLQEKDAKPVTIDISNAGDAAAPDVYVRVNGAASLAKVNKYLYQDIRDVLMKDKGPKVPAAGAAGAGLDAIAPPVPPSPAPESH